MTRTCFFCRSALAKAASARRLSSLRALPSFVIDETAAAGISGIFQLYILHRESAKADSSAPSMLAKRPPNPPRPQLKPPLMCIADVRLYHQAGCY